MTFSERRLLCASSATIWALVQTYPADSQVNLDFELANVRAQEREIYAGQPRVSGWRARDDDLILEIDGTVARTGASSLRVENRDREDRSGFSQDIDPRGLDGDRLRVSAYIKSDADAAARASLRIRIDGDEKLLYIARRRGASAPDTRGWRRLVIEAPVSARAERIEISGELSGVGVAWFDDFSIETLWARSLPAPSPAATRYVRQALSIIDEHAVTRTRLEWGAYRDAVMTQARGAVSTSDAHLAVQFALGELGDGHSYFMSPLQMSRLGAKPVGNARTSRAARAPEAALVFGDVGYLRLPGIAGGEHLDRVVFAEAVQALIGELANRATRGWILDLRANEGGNLWPMLAGVGPLLGDGEVGAALRPDGEHRSIWYRDGKVGLGDFVQLRVRNEPVRLARTYGPVAVLMDDETASAAEIVATAFAGREATRSFGSPTVGATTATRTYPLSDGAALMLAVASVTDRHGRIIEGGIVPDESVDSASHGQPLEQQAVIRAARRWLEAAP